MSTGEPLYDIVIPYHPKDTNVLGRCVDHLLQNALRAGTIFLVSAEDPGLAAHPRVCWVPEATTFPFQLSEVQAILQSEKRQGWYFQQLLKLYCFRAIPGIRSTTLLFDSDILLLRPTEFLSKSGMVAFFDYSEQYYSAYYKHAKRVLGDKWKKMSTYRSGICDHMIVRRDIMEGLLKAIEAHAGGQPAWKALIQAVAPADKDGSGMSEFELYFNWALRFHPQTHRLRKLEPKVDLEAHQSWITAASKP